jgi:hypothetical protein
VLFLLYTAQVMKQLASVLGWLFASCSPALEAILDALGMGKRGALRAFVQHPPHVSIMAALAPHMDKTKFVRWTVEGSQATLAMGRRFTPSC